MEITDDLFVMLGTAACAFANLPAISKAEDVEQHFPWITNPLLHPNAAAIYTAELDQLKAALDALVALHGDVSQADRFRHRHLRPVALENLARPARHFLRTELVFTEQGFIAGDMPAEATFGVKTGWLLFIDSALTDQRLKRVRKCAWRKCPAPYFLHLDKRGRLAADGRPRKCHPEHKKKFDKQPKED